MLLLSPPAIAREIVFAKGQNSIVIKDRIGDMNKTYMFRARKGQRLSLELIPAKDSKRKLAFTLYSYCGEEYADSILGDRVRKYTGKLPCSDRYSFDITNADDRDKSSTPAKFQLKLKIDR